MNPYISKLRVFTGLSFVMLAAIFGAHAGAQTGRLTVKVDRPGVKISPMLYGLMTEEINHAYDGGLYAELIRNRNLKENAARPVHWSLVGNSLGGSLELDSQTPLNAAHPMSLKFT